MLLRFWLMSMKSERKIDSRKTIIVRSEKGKGSRVEAPLDFIFSKSQTAKQTMCRTMNHIVLACAAITSPIPALVARTSQPSCLISAGFEGFALPDESYVWSLLASVW